MLRTNVFRQLGLLFVGLITYSIASFAETTPIPAQNASPNAVSIFVAEWCPHCKKVKTYLDALNVRYNEYDIDTPEGENMYNTLEMAQGIPIITVGHLRMDGFNAEQLDLMLCDSGVLTDCPELS